MRGARHAPGVEMGQTSFPGQIPRANGRIHDQLISGCCILNRVTTRSSSREKVLVYSYFPGIIINRAPFDF